jgi:hypothetical protein
VHLAPGEDLVSRSASTCLETLGKFAEGNKSTLFIEAIRGESPTVH